MPDIPLTCGVTGFACSVMGQFGDLLAQWRCLRQVTAAKNNPFHPDTFTSVVDMKYDTMRWIGTTTAGCAPPAGLELDYCARKLASQPRMSYT